MKRGSLSLGLGEEGWVRNNRRGGAFGQFSYFRQKEASGVSSAVGTASRAPWEARACWSPHHPHASPCQDGPYTPRVPRGAELLLVSVLTLFSP